MTRGTAVSLQEFCRIVQGGRLGLSSNDFVPSGYPAYGAGGLNGELPVHEFDESAVILSAIGARCGKCFFAEGKWTSLANTQLIFPDPARADCRFLWFQLNDERRWHRAGTGQPFIKPSDVKAHRVHLPPLSEQRHVAEVLDRAEALLTMRRAAHAQLDTLTQSIYFEMFGDPTTNPNRFPIVPLGEVFEIARGGSPRPIDSFVTEDPDGINWITIGDASAGTKYITATKRRIRRDGARKSREVKPGDFLLTNSMSFGRPYIMRTSGCIHDGWLVLSPRRNDVDSEFLYCLLGSKAVYSEFERLAPGATVKNLNIDLVRGVNIPLPPFAQQRAFASRVAAIDKVRDTQRAALAELETLLASLKHRYFSGKW